MENPLISVIVPVYKVENYLNACIESIVNQTYTNLEIILIDDGSPDNSPKICDEWAKIDNRIKVLHLENGGAGRARNIGLSVCSGSMVSFVDSDDLLCNKFYEVLLNCFDRKTDIVECDYCCFSGIFREFPKSTSNKMMDFNSEQALSKHLNDDIFKQVIWNKLYRKEIVNGVCFPEGTLIDDEFWTYKVLGKAMRLIHVTAILYAYRQQPYSMMHKCFSIERIQGLKAKEERLKYIERNFPNLYVKAKIDLYCSCIYEYQCVLKFLSGKEKKNAVEIIKYYKNKYLPSLSEIKYADKGTKKYLYLAKLSFYFCCKFRVIANKGF